MTPDEYAAWLLVLGRTPRQQYRVVLDLLVHAAEDEMSGEDRRICVWAACALEQQLRLPAGTWRVRTNAAHERARRDACQRARVAYQRRVSRRQPLRSAYTQLTAFVDA